MRRALILALLAACGEGEAVTPSGSSGADDLRALGYAGWDEDADEALSGVTLHDEGRAQPALILYADERSSLLAIDRTGARVHRWTAPEHDRVELGVLLEGGRAALLSTDQGVTLLERDSTVVWQAELSAHHDLCPLAGGGLLVPVHTEREFKGRRVRFDGIVRLDADGQEVARWDLFEAREDLAAHHAPSPLDVPPGGPTDAIYDYFHLNAVQVLPPDSPWLPGAWLICLRNLDLILALDPISHEVLYSYGPGELDAPHHPTLTPAGTLLIFDNGRRRGWSRVIEVDPHSREIVWQYRAEDFFSDVRGGAQRLPGGNTLITESERGRVFEVSPDGRVLWDYWNPEIEGAARRRIYRAARVPAYALR